MTKKEEKTAAISACLTSCLPRHTANVSMNECNDTDGIKYEKNLVANDLTSRDTFIFR